MKYTHQPVLLNEVVEYLKPQSGLIIDATVGLGGHSKAILEKCSNCRILGIDRDQQALEIAQENLKEFSDRAELVQGSFGDLLQIVGDSEVKGFLFDLGVSSLQFDDPQRGFSFQKDGPLDMRMNLEQQLTAGQIINRWPEYHLAQIIREYGEEHQDKKIAKAIAEARKKQKIETTGELKDLIEKALGIIYGGKGMRIHPATQVFQALRIAVNLELDQISSALPQAVEILKPGSRIVVISFHSLEDRIVKNIFRQMAKECICPAEQVECNCGCNNAKLKIITKKPIIPSFEEIRFNPRSRSAKMRVGERIKIN